MASEHVAPEPSCPCRAAVEAGTGRHRSPAPRERGRNGGRAAVNGSPVSSKGLGRVGRPGSLRAWCEVTPGVAAVRCLSRSRGGDASGEMAELGARGLGE